MTLRLVIMLALSLTACASATNSTQVGDRLFFGRAMGADSTVSETQWQAFVDDVVTPQFPEGLTVWRAQGQWQGANGRIVQEDVFVLEVFHDRSARADSALQRIANEYKRRFRQESVLRVTAPARVHFFDQQPEAEMSTKPPVTSTRATGTFDVKVTPVWREEAEGSALARLSLDKTFMGDLKGTSKGEMLSAQTAMDGSAGYVAIERVQGELNGRTGSFVLQHSGTMTRGKPELMVTVVPDSGTGELRGLRGTMMIKIENKQHFYDFDYSLSEDPR